MKAKVALVTGVETLIERCGKIELLVNAKGVFLCGHPVGKRAVFGMT